MLLLAVEEAELAHARAYAEAVGGREVDLREDPWLADDLAGGFVVEGGVTLDAHGRDDGRGRVGPPRRRRASRSAARQSGSSSPAAGSTASRRTTASCRCGRVVVATGPRLRFLLRTAGADLPVSSSRGWLLETGRVDPPPPYAIEQAAWPEQEEMGPLLADPTLGEVAAGSDRGAGPRLAPPRRPAGRALPDRDVARPLAPGGARRPGDRPAAGGARRARRAASRRRARRRLVVGPAGDDPGRAAGRRAGRRHRRARGDRRPLLDRDDHGAGDRAPARGRATRARSPRSGSRDPAVRRRGRRGGRGAPRRGCHPARADRRRASVTGSPASPSGRGPLLGRAGRRAGRGLVLGTAPVGDERRGNGRAPDVRPTDGPPRRARGRALRRRAGASASGRRDVARGVGE